MIGARSNSTSTTHILSTLVVISSELQIVFLHRKTKMLIDRKHCHCAGSNRTSTTKILSTSLWLVVNSKTHYCRQWKTKLLIFIGGKQILALAQTAKCVVWIAVGGKQNWHSSQELSLLLSYFKKCDSLPQVTLIPIFGKLRILVLQAPNYYNCDWQ